MGQGDSASVLTRAKVWKMREYWMYFPFFILHDWKKRSAEARSSHLSGVALENYEKILDIFGIYGKIQRSSAGDSQIWGYSSAGRALEWHSRGQRFDPAYLHHIFYRASCGDTVDQSKLNMGV